MNADGLIAAPAANDQARCPECRSADLWFDAFSWREPVSTPDQVRGGLSLENALAAPARKTWMAGASPAMTEERIIFKWLETALKMLEALSIILRGTSLRDASRRM